MEEKLVAYKVPVSNGWWNVGTVKQRDREDSTGIATLYKDADIEKWAKLFAAAPDLYEACLYAVNATEEAEVGASIDWRDVSAKLLDAIAKAEGR